MSPITQSFISIHIVIFLEFLLELKESYCWEISIYLDV